MESSDKRWKLVFSDGGAKRRLKLVEAIRKAKGKFHVSPEARVASCYEAGRDGFWLHRYLVPPDCGSTKRMPQRSTNYHKRASPNREGRPTRRALKRLSLQQRSERTRRARKH